MRTGSGPPIRFSMTMALETFVYRSDRSNLDGYLTLIGHYHMLSPDRAVQRRSIQ